MFDLFLKNARILLLSTPAINYNRNESNIS